MEDREGTVEAPSAWAERRGAGLWSWAAGVFVLAAALWLRQPTIPYLLVVAVATAGLGALALGPRAGRGAVRRWRLVSAAAALLFLGAALPPQLQLWRLEHDWERFAADEHAAAAASMSRALSVAADELTAATQRALGAPAGFAAFDHLEQLATGRGERGLTLYVGAVPLGWGGTIRVETDTLHAPLGFVRNPFYDVLYSSARLGGRRTVATVLLQARPPADELARTLVSEVRRGSTAPRVTFELAREAPAADAPGPALQLADGGWLTLSIEPLVQGEVLLRALERARTVGLALLALAIACVLGSVWGRIFGFPHRLASLGVALSAVAIVPLNALSNVTPLFDPSYYFARLGGPLTSSVGALALTSGLLLLALLALLRGRPRVRARLMALGGVLLVAGVGPFLLRELSRGIAAPGGEVPASLWLAWQLALFLAATAVLLVGASAGRALLGEWRGLHPAIAPTIAVVAALLGQPLWEAPGGWPDWYPSLWIAAAAALGLTRRSRTLVTGAATVAALGAMTLVWGSSIATRVQLAERDVAGLSRVDPVVPVLLERFAAELAMQAAPRNRAELLARYAESDLAAADYAVELASWSPDGALAARLSDGARTLEAAGVLAVAAEQARTGRDAVLGPVTSPTGARVVLAVPAPDGWVTSVAVAARTRLFADDPYAPLLGAHATAAEPPYFLTLVEAPDGELPQALATGERLGERPRWTRHGDVLHGDWMVTLVDRALGVHVEVELRSLAALVPRGALILLLDLLVVGVLWTLNVLAERGLPRWLRARRRRWERSYRARLTIALFGFFVVPALAFGVWTARQLQGDMRQTRELLVREVLHSATRERTSATVEDAVREAGERGDAPVLLYHYGALRGTSDPLLLSLAPLGRFLPSDVARSVGVGAHLTGSRMERVGDASVLVGYRALPGMERFVLAVPARADEAAMDRRRRDLGVLVLFAIVVGGLAALGLSGIAARQLARPIGALRRAALAIAEGEREPPLAGALPPAEFVPVFSAFRQMAADLNASRSALEEAERRTAAVLRHVASAVLAVDPAGRVLLFNPAAQALLGDALQPGAELTALGLPMMAERVQRLALHRDESDVEEELELEVRGRQVQARVTPLVHGGGAVLTLDDVTELASAQRVLAWGEMARQVAHEIKNPLTPIRLGVQHLRRAYGAGRGDYERVLGQNVERILAEIDRLDEIARAFSRYGTAPEQRPGGEPTDVAAIARDVVELERMGEQGGEVAWALKGAGEPAVALARGDELREVLLNLLENARLAHARRVNVVVSRDGSDGSGDVRLTVTDDGDGIAADVMPRIFEPHFSTRTSGSGLGLAISRRLVESWGGTIQVRSVRGEGTTVELTLAAASR